ncbi:hypothetical protein LCGC14_1911570 [marine sediment metagenome]|uniref:Uncharacterized protein n=1 Tax=marine sediment metagenome TaxID=412755 RepID=A0A0F9GGS6_9ZZZZ
MLGDLHESEKNWLRTTMRNYGHRAAGEREDGFIELCTRDVIRFIRLTEQLLRLHVEECDRRVTEWINTPSVSPVED